jgi:hypothetical protein
MFRTIHALVLVAGLLGVVGESFGQDPVTERPNQPKSTDASVAPKQMPAANAKLLATVEGREEGLITGPLAFHCYDGGKVVMIDVTKKPVEGTFKSDGKKIQFIFGNCVYEGTENKLGTLTGTARFTTGQNTGKTWNFTVGLRSLAGRSFAGTETLPGYGAVTFRYVDANTVEMIDKHGTTRGSYTQNGTQVTMTFGTVVYTGETRGDVISGSARDSRSNWNFTVNAAK